MKAMTPEELDELEMAEENASAGPWREDDGTGWGIVRTGDYPRRGVIIVNDSGDTPGQDATFIIAIRNKARRLISTAREAERLRGERDRLKGLLEEADEIGDLCLEKHESDGYLTCLTRKVPDPCDGCIWGKKVRKALGKDHDDG